MKRSSTHPSPPDKFQSMLLDTSAELIAAAQQLSRKVTRLKFSPPIAHVYNPLSYAWAPHEEYLRRFGASRKRVIFLGMNPGPYGMVQTGIPFGEIAAARDWMRISARTTPPKKQHDRRPITGFDCQRSEISGQRLWKLFAEKYGSAEAFFRHHFVVNYCPLAFLEESGCNRTPDKLPATESLPLFRICDEHLQRVVEILQPEWIIGVGAFAMQRARLSGEKLNVKLGQILHPSPASPAANKNWAKVVSDQLQKLGVWE